MQGTRQDIPMHPEEADRLRERIIELEETLEAIRLGQVDALVHGTDVFTLESAESASNRFRGQVLQQINDTVIAVDLDYRITYVNEAAERIYGIVAEEVLGLPLTAMYTYEWVVPEEEERSLRALAEEGVWRGEHIHVKLDGQRLHVESVVTALRDGESQLSGYLSVMRDITQLVADRAALRENDQQKDRFLATLAHELRNPLSPLMNGLQLLDCADAEGMALTRNMMQRQLDNLVRLVDDLMDVSRITRGKLELRKRPLDLHTVLSTAVEASKPLIEQRKHALSLGVADGTFTLMGDDTRLAHIISNLLNNAAKYTPLGGRISVQLARDGEQAVLTVTDNGIGIEPEAISSLFDMFTQAASPGNEAGGLGIGLNIAQRLTHMHRGTLRARSGGLGKGSTFELRLPLVREAAGAQAAPGGKLGQEPDAALRVMIVDDNKDVADTLAMILRRRGHAVEVANDGVEALSKGAGFQPQVVFMDIGMPRMDGHQACEHMRKERWGQLAHIVAVSGWGQDEDRQRSHRAGFDEHLIKPIERRTIDRVLVRFQGNGAA